jgi:hypothetical protein
MNKNPALYPQADLMLERKAELPSGHFMDSAYGAFFVPLQSLFVHFRFIPLQISRVYLSRYIQEDRQALLHEGSGSAAVSAYVEIIFDNRDGRFQGFSTNQSDEIVLRRTVGSKKDEIFLQRKKTSKNEVMSLLEGAGFSKSNPYFIVQQGKVNALCVMKDEERLELLKEVAGTTVYDEKKAESEKKMIENQNSMETIQETLTFMEDRLEELRGEKEELTIYQKLDRGRKSLAYTLYDKELRRARETLDEIEHKKAEEAENRVIVYERARNLENEITTVEAGLKTKTMSLRRNKIVLEETEEVSSCHVSLVITHIVFDVSHVINTNSTSIGPYSSHDTSYQVRASVQRRRGERRYGRSQLSQKQTRNRRAQRKNC